MFSISYPFSPNSFWKHGDYTWTRAQKENPQFLYVNMICHTYKDQMHAMSAAFAVDIWDFQSSPHASLAC